MQDDVSKRRGRISVGYTGTPGDGGHIRASGMYVFTWLPKGYGPSMEDRRVCVVFPGDLESSVRRGERHPLIEAVAMAIENYMLEHPDEQVGWLENVAALK